MMPASILGWPQSRSPSRLAASSESVHQPVQSSESHGELIPRPQHSNLLHVGQGDLAAYEGYAHTGGSLTDYESLFAFHPPTAAGQQGAQCETRARQIQLAAPDHTPSPSSEDAHTLAGSPCQLITKPGPNRFSPSVHFGPRFESSRIDYPQTRPLGRSNLRTGTNVPFRYPDGFTDEKSKSCPEPSESALGFDFDDGDSNEGSKELEVDPDWTDPSEDSPFSEVRASVSNIDEPAMPVLTFRVWTIGITLCTLSAGLNTFFNFRFPAPYIVPLVLVLLSYPVGKIAAYLLPIAKYRLPPWLGSHEFSFNPGPWNIKEHACVFLMANVSITPAYAMNTIVVSELFYGIKLGIGFNLTLVLATQLTGFGIAGLARRFLVWPASMVWPQNLVVCTLLNTLHAEEGNQSSELSRYKFFIITSGAAFLYYFLPGFLFKALSIFSYICWMAPNNVVVNQLFGVRSGLGMGILTWDWSQISFIGSPLAVPWWAQVHVFVGFVVFYWIIAPALYYTNVWNLAHLPMVSNDPFDNTGHRYNISRVMTAEQHTFNVTAYDEYSPLYLPAAYVVTYLLSFALSTCVLVHTVLYHGCAVLAGITGIHVEEDDVHAKLMRNYPEVPDWWYATFLTFFFCVAVIAAEVWDTGTPIWALLLSVILPVIYILPSGFIYAITGQTIAMNLLGEIIPGTLLPGRPMANMIFKAYSVQTLSESLSFVQDLKLGHYIKTPPRACFTVQAVATIVAAFVQVGVKEWMFANIHDLCSHNQKDSLTCPHNEVFFTASAVWGLIGPSRQFGKGSIYGPELYALLFGALIPLPLWFLQRYSSQSKLPHISMPVFLNGPSFIPPATGINYSSWFAVGFVFQYLARTRNFAWWSKFNYVLSAALDSGTVLSICAIFFFLEFPAGGVTLNWIGNNIFVSTADWKVLPLLPPPPPPETF